MSRIAIIGAGASGLLSAILLAKKGHQVDLFEANDRVGKKILVSGNGHCNISNSEISSQNYTSLEPEFVTKVLEALPASAFEKLMRQLGMLLLSKSHGRLYPLSYEAKSVTELFMMHLELNKVKLFLETAITGIEKDETFTLFSETQRFEAYDRVIIATGSLAASQLGGSDSGVIMAQSLGHSAVDFYPALVQLELEGSDFVKMSGVKQYAKATLFIDKQQVKSVEGDVLFTSYGISGLAILDLSTEASSALAMDQSVELSINLLPQFDRQMLSSKIQMLTKPLPQANLKVLLATLVSSKIVDKLFEVLKLDKTLTAQACDTKLASTIANQLLQWRFKVKDTHGFKHAEACGGGLLTYDIDPKSMESKHVSGLHILGEVLDVVGDRGGYNFHFAWACAHVVSQAI